MNGSVKYTKPSGTHCFYYGFWINHIHICCVLNSEMGIKVKIYCHVEFLKEMPNKCELQQCFSVCSLAGRSLCYSDGGSGLCY